MQDDKVFTQTLFSFVIGFLLVFAVIWQQPTNGAPSGRKYDEIVGPFNLAMKDAPTIELPTDNNQTITYWMVFTDPAIEVQAHKFEKGQRVKVRGKLAAGGEWRYFIVSEISRE